MSKSGRTHQEAFGVHIPFVEHLGFEMGFFEDGRSELHYNPKAEHLNSFAVAHGGAIMTLLDVSMATAARSVDKAAGIVTMRLSSSFSRIVRAETLKIREEPYIEAARALGLEGVFEVIVVPRSQPQTKPKACNFALRFARGTHAERFEGVAVQRAMMHMPLLPEVLAWFACRTVQVVQAGDHDILIGEVVDFASQAGHGLGGVPSGRRIRIKRCAAHSPVCQNSFKFTDKTLQHRVLQDKAPIQHRAGEHGQAVTQTSKLGFVTAPLLHGRQQREHGLAKPGPACEQQAVDAGVFKGFHCQALRGAPVVGHALA